MLRKTIETLFQRHGIPLNDVDKANEIIEFILFDNPSILYTQNRQDGIYEIDWENEIMYIREYRKDVQFDDFDRTEICLEFENIQRISFKLNRTDYEENLLPGTTLGKIKNEMSGFSITKQLYDSMLLSELDNNYKNNIINLAKSLSINKLEGKYLDKLLIKADNILLEIGTYIKSVSKPIYDNTITNLEKAKNDILSYPTDVSITEAMVKAVLNNAIRMSIDKNVIDVLYTTNKHITIEQFINTEFNKEINTIMLSEKHESYLASEVKLGVLVEDEINLNAEIILLQDSSSNLNAETKFAYSGSRYVNAELDFNSQS